jgi:hypothetical protein
MMNWEVFLVNKFYKVGTHWDMKVLRDEVFVESLTASFFLVCLFNFFYYFFFSFSFSDLFFLLFVTICFYLAFVHLISSYEVGL